MKTTLMSSLTAQWIASRSSFPQWGDSWGQLARDSPTARAVAEARQGEVALPGSMALTSNTIIRALGRALGLALALDLVGQVVLGATRAEEVLLAHQGLVRQEQTLGRQVEEDGPSRGADPASAAQSRQRFLAHP